MINLRFLSKYRTQLMGIAALLIIICHAPSYGVELPHYIRILFVWGNVGVDIFLFLSGLGCFYSLGKFSGNKLKWVEKRYKRIAIPYIIVQLIFLLYLVCTPDFSFLSWLYEFSTLSFWTKHVGCWYVAFLIPLYALTPFLFVMMRINGTTRHIVFFFTILLIIVLTLGADAVKENTSIIYNVRWTFKRLPGFLLGLYLAPYIMQGKKIHALVLVGITLIGFLVFNIVLTSTYGWWFYVPFICITCCYMIKYLLESTIVNTFLLFIGGASLESYLTNIGTKAIMPSILFPYRGHPIFSGFYLDYILIIVIGLFLTYFSHKLSKIISQKL